MRAPRAKDKHKKTRDTVYVCGDPNCEARVVLWDRGDAVKYQHRDKLGFRCEKLMVKYSLSPMGIREEIKMRWQIFKMMRRQEREAAKRPTKRG